MSKKEMNKEEFKAYILNTPKPKKMTPEEAFEAGKRGDMTEYNAAGCQCAAVIYGHFQKHPDKLKKVVKLYNMWEGMKKRASSFKDVKKFSEAYLKMLDDCEYPRSKTTKYGTIEYGKIYPHSTIEDLVHNYGQDIVGIAMDTIDNDEEINKAVHDIGPSGFMWSWAFNAAVYLLNDEPTSAKRTIWI